MKEFNPKKASLATFYRKIETFWENKQPNQLYSVLDLTQFLNLSNRWKHDIYKSDKIVPLIQKKLIRLKLKL